MYCPSCGSEDRNLSQFCRSCGTDLRPAKPAAEQVDPLTASAISAREQVSLAVADKIRQMESAREMRRVAEDVLPALDKFLRTPEERRLRRIRIGVIVSGIGLASLVSAFLAALGDSDFLPMLVPTFIIMMVGLSVVINGVFFTLPRKKLTDGAAAKIPAKLRGVSAPEYQQPLVNSTTNDLGLPSPVPSVTDHTTHHLKSKQ